MTDADTVGATVSKDAAVANVLFPTAREAVRRAIDQPAPVPMARPGTTASDSVARTARRGNALSGNTVAEEVGGLRCRTTIDFHLLEEPDRRKQQPEHGHHTENAAGDAQERQHEPGERDVEADDAAD